MTKPKDKMLEFCDVKIIKALIMLRSGLNETFGSLLLDNIKNDDWKCQRATSKNESMVVRSCGSKSFNICNYLGYMQLLISDPYSFQCTYCDTDKCNNEPFRQSNSKRIKFFSLLNFAITLINFIKEIIFYFAFNILFLMRLSFIILS